MKRILIVIGAAAILVATGFLFSASSLQVPSGTWVPVVGGMTSARIGAATVLLQDGRILITGGSDANGPSSAAEFFGANGSFSLATPMNVPRSGHVAVILQDGTVLVAGGTTSGGVATNSAEIFDPVANTWTNVTGGMGEARSGATAAVLQDGRVLVAGGQNGSNISKTLEIFDPALGAFTSLEITGTMSSPRTQHAMTVLQDGRVLIVGGFNGSIPVASTDIVDPVAGAVSAGPSLMVARFGHSATTLLNGQVVVIGGNNGNANPAQMDVTPTELIDFTVPPPAPPAPWTFTALTATLATPREGHLAFLLPNNNNVLIVGGTSGGTTIASAELFTPQESALGVWTYVFGATGSMATARSNATGAPNQVSTTSTVMQLNGVLMVAGGADTNGNALKSAEAYGFPTVQTDQSDYPPGTPVTITGSGFQPGETVTIQLVESPFIDTHGPYTVNADVNGNISDSSFTTDFHDVNVLFYLTATGGTSGFQAQTSFADGTSDGSGTMVVSPTTAVAGSTGNSFTFTFTADPGKDLTTGAQVTVQVPSGWTAPQIGSSSNPGFVSVANGTPVCAGAPSIASVSSGLITISINCAAKKAFTLTYAGGGTKVTAPNPAGANTFTTQTMQGGVGSTLTAIGSSPVVTVTAGTATQYLVTSSNNSPVAGTAVTITAQLADTNGNPVSTSGKTVTWSKTGSGGSFSAGTSTTNGSGVASVMFTTGTVVGTVYTVTATDNSSLTGTSGNITTMAGTATKYLVTSSSNSPAAGTAVTITAQLADANGNPVSTSGKTVTWSKTGSGGSFSTGTSTTNGSGVASVMFTTGTVAGTVYTVTATDNTSVTGTSGNITTVAGTATQYLVTSSSNSPAAGTAVTITAQLADANGNPVSTSGKTVTWSKTGSGGSFSAGTSTTNGSGVASVMFTTGTVAGTVYTVTATDNTSLTGTSGNITTVAGGIDHFAISAISLPQTVGTAFNIATITAQDVSNNTVTSFTSTVTFGGTAGVTGTSAAFTLGVLTNASVTPTLAGSNLTVTVTDGASPSHTGSATIATVNPKLAVTSTAFAILTGTCSLQVSVQTQNANGTAATLTTATVLNLSSSAGTGKFFSDAGCTISISSATIAASSSTTSFYYDDTTIGSPVITVASTGLTSTTQAETITGLRFGSTLFSVQVNSCSSAITLQSANSTGSGPTSLTQLTTITLSSSSGGGKFYSDATCTTLITSTTIGPGIDAGHDSPSFYYKDTSAGAPTLTASAGTTSTTQTESVVTPLSISKVFGASTIAVNGTTSLTFTITNPAANTVSQTGVGFTDTFPSGLVVATPNGLSNTCAGAPSAVAGSGLVSLTGGTVGVNTSCTLSVNVTGTTSGLKTNTTGNVSSTNGGTGNTASASLTVATPPTISKAFGASPISYGGSTSLSFTITNPNTISLTGLAFSDTLPSGLVVSTPNALNSTCNGTTTANAGSGTVSLSAGTIAASTTCSISVNVTATSLGTLNNTTGPITSNESGQGTTSNTASLTVNPAAPAFSSLTASPTIAYGTPSISLSGTLSAPGPQYPPSGSTVSITINGTTVTPTTNATGGFSTTFSTGTIPASATAYTIDYEYAASANFKAASDKTTTLTVNAAATTTSISAPAVTYPANGVVTVTVSSTAGAVTGNVTLTVDGTPSTEALDLTGAATFTLTKPSAGSHSLSASYAAQGNFAASGPTTGTLTVIAAATTTSISAPAVTYPANGNVTVTVGFAAGPATGNVTLTVNGTPSTEVLDGAGQATFTLTRPSAGSYSLSASYTAQGNFAASGPTTGTLTVIAAGTTTSINAPTVTYPANGVVTVTVSSTAGAVTGNVTLTVDGTPSIEALDVTGAATFTLTKPSAGIHTLSASYAAQGNFAASGPTPGTLTVIQAMSSVTVTCPVTPQTYTGTAQTPCTASYSTSDGLSGTLTVSYTNNTAVGTPGASATYPGDTNHAGSTGTSSFTISQATLYIIANDKTRAYSDSNPTFDVAYMGFQGTDNASSLTGTPTCTTTATTGSSPAGTYAITCSGQTSSNYNIVYVNGQLTVTNPLVSITVNPPTPTIHIGDTEPFTAFGAFEQGSRNLGSAGGSWASAATMPTWRAGDTAAELNGHLYVISGTPDGSNVTSSVDVYDPVAGTWASPGTVANIPTGRVFARAAVAGGLLYVVGGCTNVACTSPTGALEVYDPVHNSWSSKASMPTARYDMAVGYINGMLYVAGGTSGSGIVGTVEIYSPATDSWTTGTSMLTARTAAAAGVINGLLYVAGGSTSGGPVGTLESYDPTANSWSPLASLTTPQSFAGGAVVNGLLYAISGIDGGSIPTMTVQAYDPTVNLWTNQTPISSGLNDGQPVAIGGLIYVAGNGVGNSPNTTLQVYTPDEATWSSGTPAVGLIDATGLATGSTGGTSLITATSLFNGSIFGSTTLTVTVPTTVTTSPPGLQIIVDGMTYAAPQTFYFNASTSHTINVPSPQSAGTNEQYVWTSWSDTGTQSHSITVGTTGATYTATFTTQYKITFAQNGIGGDSTGTVVTFSGTQNGSATGSITKTAAYLPYSAYFDSGTAVSYSYSTPVSAGAGKQYVLDTSVNPNPSPASITSLSAATVVTGTYKTQWQITFAQSGMTGDQTGTIVTVNGSPESTLPYAAYYDAASTITYTYASPVAATTMGKQYALTTPAPTPASGFAVSSALTVTGTYKTQWQVTFKAVDQASATIADASGTVVTVNSVAQTANPYQAYYDQGSVSFSFQAPLASTVTGKQYRFVSASTSSPITLSTATTVTGNYQTQYQVTFKAVDQTSTTIADASGTVVTVNSVAQTANPYQAYYDQGSVSFSFQAPLASTVTGKQYRFVSASTSSPITLSTATTVTGNYQTQYQVTFKAVDQTSATIADASGTVVTVNSVAQTANPYQTYYDQGSVSFSFQAPLASTVTGKQYRFVSASTSSPITLSTATTVTGNYQTQYQVTFKAVDQTSTTIADASGTVVTVNSVVQTANPYQAYYDQGSVSFSFQAPLASTVTGKQYRFVSASTSSPITLSTATTVTGNYQTQYQVTFKAVDQTSATIADASGTVVTVNSVAQTANPYQAYYDQGSVSFSFQAPLASTVTGKQYRFVSASTSSPITLSTATTVTGNYQTQYLLTLGISPAPPLTLADITGGTTGTFYDSGKILYLTATTPISSGGTGYVFSAWSGTITSSNNPLTVTMSQPQMITATYNTWTLAWDQIADQQGCKTTFCAQYSDPTGLVAQLVMNGTNVSGKMINFTAGTTAWSASTNSSGIAADTNPASTPSDRLTQAPGSSYTATASCVVSQCGVALSITNPFTINQEDAQITYTGLNYFSTTSTASSMSVTVTYTLQDATATGATSPIYDPYAGDITKAKVTLTLTGVLSGLTGGSCSTLPVVAVAGEVDPTNGLPSTGTVSCTINNVTVPGVYNLAATPAAGSYYTFTGDTSESITTANGGTGFITGGGFQTAAYLATPGPTGKYTTAGLLKPAANTKMNFGFETKYNKGGSNLQGGANIIIRSACVTGIAGYTAVPGHDDLCVYQIKSNGNGNITSLSETLTAPKSPNNAVFTARNVTIEDVTWPTALVVAGNVNLELNMYDVAEPGANADTLTIYVYDSVNGLWISNNWSGVQTVISATAPVIQGGNLQVH